MRRCSSRMPATLPRATVSQQWRPAAPEVAAEQPSVPPVVRFTPWAGMRKCQPLASCGTNSHASLPRSLNTEQASVMIFAEEHTTLLWSSYLLTQHLHHSAGWHEDTNALAMSHSMPHAGRPLIAAETLTPLDRTDHPEDPRRCGLVSRPRPVQGAGGPAAEATVLILQAFKPAPRRLVDARTQLGKTPEPAHPAEGRTERAAPKPGARL